MLLYRSLRVLLVEDNAVNQKVASRPLERQGHSVLVAANGRAALDALAGSDFDLVLVDVQMPVMDGLDTTAAIRRREAGSGRDLPVIALTADARDGDRKRCLEAGMDGYVTKPVHLPALQQAMAEVLAVA